MPYGSSLVMAFCFLSVLHLLVHGGIVVVEVLGPFDTSKFNKSADSSTWTRCNIPFWRAVAACGTHLLLSTLGWISCVKGSHVGLLAFSVGTTLVVATATPLTLLPLLTACGPPMAVPTEDIFKIAAEAGVQFIFGMATALIAAVIPMSVLSGHLSKLSTFVSTHAPVAPSPDATKSEPAVKGAAAVKPRDPATLQQREVEFSLEERGAGGSPQRHATPGKSEGKLEMSSVFQALVSSNEELKRANSQLIGELSSRNGGQGGAELSPTRGMMAGGGGAVSPARGAYAAGTFSSFSPQPPQGGNMSWPTLDEHGRVAVTLSFDGAHASGYMDAAQKRAFSEALRLDIAFVLEVTPDRILVTNVTPSAADVLLSNYTDGAHDLRTSTDLGTALIAQAQDRASSLRQSVSGSSIVAASWRPAWRTDAALTNMTPAASHAPSIYNSASSARGSQQGVQISTGPLDIDRTQQQQAGYVRTTDINPSLGQMPRMGAQLSGRNSVRTSGSSNVPTPRASRSPSPNRGGGDTGHGLGRLENNGRVCEGSWAKINGKLIGVGIISFPSGASYQGEWLEHEPHGYGVETSELGAVFEGEFNLGEKHGFGCLTEPDGKKQVGCWSKGKREGWLLSIAAHGAPLTLREHKNDAFVGRQLDGQCEDAKRVQRQAESVLDKARSVASQALRYSEQSGASGGGGSALL